MARPIVRELILLSLLLLCAPALPSADLAITADAAYLSPESSPLANPVILIHNGKIAAVGSRDSVPIPATTTRLDFPGCYITAGFWNSHVHIILPELLHAAQAPAADLNTQMELVFNRWGFTTVFDIASVLQNTLALRHRVDAGQVRGPSILTTGEPVWTIQPVYITGFLLQQHVQMPVVQSPAQATRQVALEIAQGASGVKLFTGSVQAHNVVNMPLSIALAAATEAHRHHLPVFAHPQNSTGVDVAIQAGVDILAHVAPQAENWSSELVPRLISAHMALIPTLTLFDFEARKMNLPDAERASWVNNAVAQARVFAGAGGELIFGTDIGYTTHFDTRLEFQLLSEAGMDYRAILAALTTAPAHRFGLDNRRGRLKAGMEADLAVLENDPARDIAAFSQVKATIRGGEVIFSKP